MQEYTKRKHEPRSPSGLRNKALNALRPETTMQSHQLESQHRLVEFQNLIRTDQESLASPIRETTDKADPLGPLTLRPDYFHIWKGAFFEAVDSELSYLFEGELSVENNAMDFDSRFKTVCWARHIPLMNVLQWTKDGKPAGFDLDDVIVLKYRIAMMPVAMMPAKTVQALQILAQKTANFDRLDVKVAADPTYITVHASRED